MEPAYAFMMRVALHVLITAQGTGRVPVLHMLCYHPILQGLHVLQIDIANSYHSGNAAMFEAVKQNQTKRLSLGFNI